MYSKPLPCSLHRVANLLDIKGENIYKLLAYRRAAEVISETGQDVAGLWREGKLSEIQGVGKAISEKIDELLTTGQLNYLIKLEEEVPVSLLEMLQVPSVGPKKVSLFWRQASVTGLQGLEEAAQSGRLRNLPGMGAKSEAKIIEGIAALRRRSGRIPLGRAWPAAQELLAFLRSLPDVTTAEPAGSLRRMRATIGDIDLVAAAADPRAVMDAFIHHPGVLQVLGSGEAKSSIELVGGLRAQLWVQPPERFGTALQFATGSKDHNVRLRALALSLGFSLSEKELAYTTQDGSLLCASEEEVYRTLGLPWIPPELREDRGEIEAARLGKLPNLVSMADMRADLHCPVHCTGLPLHLERRQPCVPWTAPGRLNRARPASWKWLRLPSSAACASWPSPTTPTAWGSPTGLPPKACCSSAPRSTHCSASWATGYSCCRAARWKSTRMAP